MNNKIAALLQSCGSFLEPQALRFIVAGDAMTKLAHINTAFTAKEDFINEIENYEKSNHLLIVLREKIKNVCQKLADHDLFQVLNQLNSFSLDDDFKALNYYLALSETSKGLVYSYGKRAGLDDLILALAQVRPDETVLDPTCGVNGAWLELLKRNPVQELSLQEVNDVSAALAYLNTKILNATKTHVYLGDSISGPKYVKNGKLQQFDKVLTFPPISTKVSSEAIKANKFNRFRYGRVSSSLGDLAFISNALASLKEQGKAVIIVSDGLLFRGAANKAFRQNLLKRDWLETVIALPKRILPHSSTHINILIVNKDKGSFKDKIQFINAEQKEWHQKESWGNALTAAAIKEIVKLYETKNSVNGKAAVINDSDYQDTLDVKQYVLPQAIKINGIAYHINQNELQQLDYVPLTKLVEIKRGYNITRSSEAQDGYFSALKVASINDNHEIDYSNVTKINIKTDPTRYLLEKDDILLSTRGTIGKIGFIDKEVKNMVTNANLAILRAKTGQINMQWLMLYLASPLGQFMIKQKISGTAIATITASDLADIKVPQVALKEQNQATIAYNKTKKQLDQQRAKLLKKYHTNDEKLYESMAVNKVLRQN